VQQSSQQMKQNRILLECEDWTWSD